MTNKQENKIRMYEAVSEVLAEHAESVRTVNAFPSAVKQFDAAIAEIRTQGRCVREVSIGKTAAQNNSEQVLIAVVLKVSSALSSMAHRTGNHELKAKVMLNKSRLERISQAKLEEIAKVLYDIAVGCQEQLTAFGVDAALIDELNAANLAYNEAIGRKEGGFAERSSAVQAIKALFRANDQHLRNDLDQLMELFRTDQAKFYNAYWAARYIKNLGHRFKTAPAEEVKAS